MLTTEIREELVKGLCDIFHDRLCQIVLYGSVARSEDTAESDIDIAIILDGKMTEKEHEKFIEFTSGLDLKYERVFSMIDIERSHIEKWEKILPFYRKIREEGIVLWKTA